MKHFLALVLLGGSNYYVHPHSPNHVHEVLIYGKGNGYALGAYDEAKKGDPFTAQCFYGTGLIEVLPTEATARAYVNTCPAK